MTRKTSDTQKARGLFARMAAREVRLRRGEDASPKAFRRAYWKSYNRLSLIIIAVILLVYIINGRSILWRVDGLEQYYPFFVYEGEWIRSIVGSVLAGHPEVPLWNWSLGYGADVIVTLDVIFDPFNLSSALVPASLSEYMYQAMLLVRLWVAGAAFSAYSLRRGNGRYATLLGAVAYVTSATLLEGLIWPGSMVGAIALPLVLVGAERLFAGERPYLLVVASFVLFLASYYFAYIIFLFLVAYCAVRVFQVERQASPRVFLGWVARFAGCIAIGCLMACVSLVPALTALFETARFTSSTVAQSPVYDLSYYVGIVPGILSSYQAGSDCNVGYGGVVFIACVALLVDRRESDRALMRALVIMSALILVPLAGSVLNGFNYATNRWLFVYAMLVSYALVRMAPTLVGLSARQRRALVAATAVMSAWILLVSLTRTEKNVAALFCLMACLAPLVAEGVSAATRRYSLLVGLLLCFSVNVFYFVDAGEGGIANSSVALTAAWRYTTADCPINVVTEVDDDSFWRYDLDPGANTIFNNTYSIPRNNNVVTGLKGYSFYNSIYNSRVDQFHTELGLVGADINFSYSNLGARSFLMALGSTKYYLLPADGASTAPYGFDDEANVVAQDVVNGGTYKVYEASDYLPFGFTFSSVIDRDVYESLDQASRQQALLQGVVLDGDDASSTSLPATSLSLIQQELPYVVSASSGCTLEGDRIVVDSADATLTLSFDGVANSSLYLETTGLDMTGLSPLDLYSATDFAKLRWYQKAKVYQQQLSYSAPSSYVIYATSDKGSSRRYIPNSVKTLHMYGGKTDWLLDLGYSSSPQTSVTLRFNTAGTYSFTKLAVVSQPMDAYYPQIDALKQETLQNVEMADNRFSGTISLPSEKVLFLSVPYSEGWSVTVDGQPAKILCADTAFMALDLPAGDHTVKFTYMTPGLMTGAMLSLVGLAVFAAVIVACECRRRSGARAA